MFDILIPDPLSQTLMSFDFRLITYVKWIEEEQRVITNEILPHFKMVIVQEGSCEIRTKHGTKIIEKGDIVLIPIFELFTATCLGDIKTQLYIFHFDVSDETMRYKFIQQFRCKQLTVYSNLLNQDRLKWFHITYKENTKTPGYYYSLSILLRKTLSAILIEHNVFYTFNENSKNLNTSVERIFIDCLDYLKDHYYENTKVSELCEAVNVSQSYLYQCFMEIKGCSTKDFITTYRLKQITSDLRNSTMSLSKISELYNYSSPIAFSASFKNQYGISPANYRKQYKEGKK